MSWFNPMSSGGGFVGSAAGYIPFAGADGSLTDAVGLAFVDGALRLDEQASAPTAAATYGYLWIKNTTPTSLMFTADDGTDIDISAGSPNNSLDNAYDQPTAGAGRTITVDSGPVQLNASVQDALGIALATTTGISAISITEDAVGRTAAMIELVRDASSSGPAVYVGSGGETLLNPTALIAVVNATAYDTFYTKLVTSTTAQAFVVEEDNVVRTAPMMSLTRSALATGPILDLIPGAATSVAINARGGAIGLSPDGLFDERIYATDNHVFVYVRGVAMADFDYYTGCRLLRGAVIPDDIVLGFGTGSGSDAVMCYLQAQTPDALVLGLGADSNGFIVCEKADIAYDFAHALQTNPTLWIQSATQSATQWLSFAHDQTNAVITSGAGDVSLVPASTITRLNGSIKLAELAAAPADTTAYGQFWVKSDAPCTPWFTGDTGVDYQLAALNVAQNWTAGQHSTPVLLDLSGATTSLDVDGGNQFYGQLSLATTALQSPTNIAAGQWFNIDIQQAAAGGKALTFVAAYDFGDAGAPDFTSLAANSYGVISCHVLPDGVNIASSCSLNTSLIGAGTDNHIPRYDGTAKLQDSVLTIADQGGAISAVGVELAFAPASGYGVTIAQAVCAAATPAEALTITGGAHTTVTASAEAVDVLFDLARTVQWATGAIAAQRAVFIEAPTYGFVGASTITDAATLYIQNAPVAGTNATITNAWALWIDAGRTRMDGNLFMLEQAAADADLAAYGQFWVKNAAPNIPKFTDDAGTDWSLQLETRMSHKLVGPAPSSAVATSVMSATGASEEPTNSMAMVLCLAAGSVTGLAGVMSATRDADVTLAVEISTDAGDSWAAFGTACTLVIAAGNRGNQAIIIKGSHAFAAGNVLRVKATYTGSSAAAVMSADINVEYDS